jgi:hypothetical protein
MRRVVKLIAIILSDFKQSLTVLTLIIYNLNKKTLKKFAGEEILKKLANTLRDDAAKKSN